MLVSWAAIPGSDRPNRTVTISIACDDFLAPRRALGKLFCLKNLVQVSHKKLSYVFKGFCSGWLTSGSVLKSFALCAKGPAVSGRALWSGAQPIFDLGAKADRWVPEMLEISKTLGTTGMTPKIFQGAADIYRFVAGTAIDKEKF